jgi:hypothetical protein
VWISGGGAFGGLLLVDLCLFSSVSYSSLPKNRTLTFRSPPAPGTMLRRTGVKWYSGLEFGLIDVERERRADVPIADTGWTAGEGVEGAFEGVQRPPETDAVFFVDVGELGCFAADVEAEGEGVADGDAADCPRAAWSVNPVLSELRKGRGKKERPPRQWPAEAVLFL